MDSVKEVAYLLAEPDVEGVHSAAHVRLVEIVTLLERVFKLKVRRQTAAITSSPGLQLEWAQPRACHAARVLGCDTSSNCKVRQHSHLSWPALAFHLAGTRMQGGGF